MKIPLLSFFLLLISCHDIPYNASDYDIIKEILRAQQDAWNDGDKDRFMEAYWKSDSLLFYGSGGPTYGWQSTLENYHIRYPDKSAMGELTFTIEHLSKIEAASCLLMGTYHLRRQDDELNGFFTLVWKKIDGEWQIVADMTCAL